MVITMIKYVIINQHKGLFDELRDHLLSYEKMTSYDECFMVLVVDQEVWDSERYWLVQFENQHSSNIRILFHTCNLGLSLARSTAIKWLIRNARILNISDNTPVILGCTNCKYISSIPNIQRNYINLIKCDYVGGDLFERFDFDTHRDPLISFCDYFNNESKPDFTISIPYKWINQFSLTYLGVPLSSTAQSYYPEELELHKIISDNFRMEDKVLFVIDDPFQQCWYNETGLSKTFNRSFMINNNIGFFDRAYFILADWLDGRLTALSYNRIKYLMYDLVTLADDRSRLAINLIKGTVLEPLYYWTLQRWLNNDDHHHSFKFIEDEK